MLAVKGGVAKCSQQHLFPAVLDNAEQTILVGCDGFQQCILLAQGATSISWIDSVVASMDDFLGITCSLLQGVKSFTVALRCMPPQ